MAVIEASSVTSTTDQGRSGTTDRSAAQRGWGRGVAVVLWVLIALPAVAHVAGMTAAAARGAEWWFGTPDLLAFVGSLVYVGVGALVARRLEHAARFILITYSVLLAVATGE